MVKEFSHLPKGTYYFRSMMEDPNAGTPSVGPTNFQLGVRTDAVQFSDVQIDDSGLVRPRTSESPQGMSVAPSTPLNLPIYRRPPIWGGERGRDYPVWFLADDDLGPNLAFYPDDSNPTRHGVIGPARSMPFEQYRAALEATRELWEIVIP